MSDSQRRRSESAAFLSIAPPGVDATLGGACAFSSDSRGSAAQADADNVRVSTPFTFSGDLKGFDVVGRCAPRLVFDLPFTGQGTVTLELLSSPSTSRPSLSFLRLTDAFEP